MFKKCLGLFLFGVFVLIEAEARPIRVRVSKSLQSVQVSGLNMGAYVDGKKSRHSLASDFSKLQIERFAEEGRRGWLLRWNGSQNASFHPGENLEITGISLKMGKLRLPRQVAFRPTSAPGRKFDLISEMDVETYLTGVLPKEMPPSWPFEALKAQAVAARSYAHVKMKEREKMLFDVESSVFDQAFEFNPEHFKTAKWSDRIHKAVFTTRGQVLVVNDRVIKAYYHADCGGRTELASQVWGGETGYNGVVASCFHPSSGSGGWSYEVDKDILTEKLKSQFNLSPIEVLKSARASSLSGSGRVRDVLFRFINAKVEVSSQRLRQLVGFERIKSTLFRMEMTQDKIVFSGLGNGHGVGMCQHGARFLASSGKSHSEILVRYFPAAKIKEVRF